MSNRPPFLGKIENIDGVHIAEWHERNTEPGHPNQSEYNTIHITPDGNASKDELKRIRDDARDVLQSERLEIESEQVYDDAVEFKVP